MRAVPPTPPVVTLAREWGLSFGGGGLPSPVARVGSIALSSVQKPSLEFSNNALDEKRVSTKDDIFSEKL